MSASLFRALCSACERPQDYDVRLQGSWAFFFSGRHKDFPTERDLAGQPVAAARFQEWMGSTPLAERPARRPFDALHKLGMLDGNGKPLGPSDGDFHISSDAMVAEARAKWDELKSAGKLSDEDIRKGFVHQKYSFINRTAVREAFPDLEKWSTVWEERLVSPSHRRCSPAPVRPTSPRRGTGSPLTTGTPTGW